VSLPADLVTGHGTIDEQHARIIALVERLPEDPNIDHAIDEVMDHLTGHFALEEVLMHATSYPSLYEHIRQHLLFFDRFISLRARWNAHRDDAARGALVSGLASWLRDHVLGHDVEMAKHLRSMGSVETWPGTTGLLEG
jgi:hemerythrin-like metal-binding protein